MAEAGARSGARVARTEGARLNVSAARYADRTRGRGSSVLGQWQYVVTGVALGWLVWIACRAIGFWDIVPLGSKGAALAFGVVGGALWLFRRGRLTVLGALLGLLAVVCLVVLTPITRPMAQSLIRRDAILAGTVPVADAVIVLGAGVSDAGLLNDEGMDRMIAALGVVRAGRAPLLVLSRPAESLRLGNRPDTDWQRLLELLPQRPRIDVLDSTETTRDEALKAWSIASRDGWRRVVVVTSPLHTRRACAAFARVGFTVTCVPSESRDFALPLSSSAFERMTAFGMWLHEVIGWRVYRWRGWV